MEEPGACCCCCLKAAGRDGREEAEEVVEVAARPKEAWGKPLWLPPPPTPREEEEEEEEEGLREDKRPSVECLPMVPPPPPPPWGWDENTGRRLGTCDSAAATVLLRRPIQEESHKA